MFLFNIKTYIGHLLSISKNIVYNNRMSKKKEQNIGFLMLRKQASLLL
jgi:hypothetical protein